MQAYIVTSIQNIKTIISNLYMGIFLNISNINYINKINLDVVAKNKHVFKLLKIDLIILRSNISFSR